MLLDIGLSGALCLSFGSELLKTHAARLARVAIICRYVLAEGLALAWVVVCGRFDAGQAAARASLVDVGRKQIVVRCALQRKSKIFVEALCLGTASRVHCAGCLSSGMDTQVGSPACSVRV